MADPHAHGTFEYWFHPKDGPRELTFVVTSGRDDILRVPVRAAADERVELVLPVR